ncbi:hypothetical protein NB574_09695 [Vibrio vulnificus]|uniref:hypothetical protein n=1 Tax=Vibrio vulnificus TaxID=672 RepID=UPI001FAF75DE|nr:hypothetical protein [Vibrio vulnificus]MCJ0815296.1 hypothetical protein [Vibrio vulnificus]MCR9703060.1 hypothetical protein [Vibrio vulnificus]
MSKKLYLRANGKNILSIKLGDASKRQRPIHGNLDVIFDTPKNNNLYGVYSCLHYEQFFERVKHISWHCFFSAREEEILNPVINVHRKGNDEKLTFRFDGVLENKDEFAYPVASFYFNDSSSLVGYQCVTNNYIDLTYPESKVDIFVLTKEIEFFEFIRKKVAPLHVLLFDVVFISGYGFVISPLDTKNMKIHHQVIDGWTLVIREHVISESARKVFNTKFPKGMFAMTYNPKQYINSVLDRSLMYDDGDSEVIRDIYNSELGLKKT